MRMFLGFAAIFVYGRYLIMSSISLLTIKQKVFVPITFSLSSFFLRNLFHPNNRTYWHKVASNIIITFMCVAHVVMFILSIDNLCFLSLAAFLLSFLPSLLFFFFFCHHSFLAFINVNYLKRINFCLVRPRIRAFVPRRKNRATQ